ncbi:hypothetical protein D3C86_1808820 [compost metagenome]
MLFAPGTSGPVTPNGLMVPLPPTTDEVSSKENATVKPQLALTGLTVYVLGETPVFSAPVQAVPEAGGSM